MKNCESEVQCRVSSCNKRYYTLLHKDILLKTDGVQHNSFNKFPTHKTFSQISYVPLTISNGNRFVHTNGILDTGSDATFLKREIAAKLDLKGSIKRLTVTKALLKTTEFDSKLVNFDLSSAFHPDKTKIQNACVVSDIDINYQIFDI